MPSVRVSTLTTNKDMEVAIQACGIVALLFIGLLVLFAFLDAHGWFSVRTETTPYLVPLSTVTKELNFWGADSLIDLREKVNSNLNRATEIVDDIGVQYPLTRSQIVKFREKFGIDEGILVEYLQEQGHTCVIIEERK